MIQWEWIGCMCSAALVLQDRMNTQQWFHRFVNHAEINLILISYGVWNMKLALPFVLCKMSDSFEACNASIAVRATDLIGIYESDNGRKGE